MSRNGDVVLDGQAMRAVAAARRGVALADAVRHDDGGWTKHTQWHWARQVGVHALDYWPSRGRWRWGGRSVRGTAADLGAFIAARTEPG